MSQFYTDAERESELWSLPDAEVFPVAVEDFNDQHSVFWQMAAENGDDPADLCGHYYWFCFPGCLPDSDPFGPFDTEAEAIADARGSI